ncbi:MAG TPA: methyltransferase domain-containing protein [Vicinamibacterales bacterium]|nr:methyltransferase domain-containing protein [Vicinamibacterales bacterium]
MTTPADMKTRAAAAYNAAADSYDAAANTFWQRYGSRTVARLDLPKGARVLDVCCGSGASALPAARQVGAGGSVVGVDLAEHLLELARAKAAAEHLANLEFRTGDMLDLQLPGAQFDAVICVFGIFQVPDMTAAARALWRLVTPGGRLAITTWGPRLFEPGNTLFWDAVRELRPELYKGFNPWDRITEPEAVIAMLATAGIDASAEAEAGRHPIATADDWWCVVMGTGYRGTVEQLSAQERAKLRAINDAGVRDRGIEEIETNVVYATAIKP